MFDPFGDYDSRGYLRNTAGEKDLEIIKIAEHELFRAQLPIALDFLSENINILTENLKFFGKINF